MIDANIRAQAERNVVVIPFNVVTKDQLLLMLMERNLELRKILRCINSMSNDENYWYSPIKKVDYSQGDLLS